MRVLLTGGVGFIGSHVAVALANAGHEPLMVDDLSNSRSSVVARVSKLVGSDVPFLRTDIRDECALSDFIVDHGPVDAVVHLAGLKAVAESVAFPERYYDVNIGSTLALLKVMRLHSIKKLVFSSSATVYGTTGNAPFAEHSTVGAGLSNPYGKTKYMIEEILRDACVADRELQVVALRYFNPVGAHPSGLLGEDPQGIPNNLLPIVARVARGELDAVTVFGRDYATADGTGERDYIHVQDLARGHLLATEFDAAGFEAFNLGTGTPSSVLDVIHTYAEASGKAIAHHFEGERPGDVAVSYADVSKAERVLGWRAMLDLRDACRDDWSWQTNAMRG